MKVGINSNFESKPGSETMTLTIELEPQDVQVLAARAARLGVPVERAAADVLRRDLQTETTSGAADIYAHSLANGGELTAFSTVQEDVYQYSADDLAAMERGEFAEPLQ